MSWFSAARTAALWNPDPRSLVALRIGLGLLLLIDALLRLPVAALLYADLGWLPRAAALDAAPAGSWSLHLVEGSALTASLLTLLQGLAAGALMIGRHLRWATLACWVLAVSTVARNPLVVTPGEAYAVLLLFWGLWLPWGAATAPGLARSPVPRGVGMGLALQVLILPWIAVRAIAVPAGAAWALGVAAAITVLALLPGPGPGPWPRRLAVLLYLAGCAAAARANLGLLPWLAAVGALALVDRGLWERLSARATLARWRLYVAPHPPALRARTERLLAWTATEAVPRGEAAQSPRIQRLFDGGAVLVLIDEHDVAHRNEEALRRLCTASRPFRLLAGLLDRPALAAALLRGLQGPALPSPTPAAWRLPPAGSVLVLAIGILALAVQGLGQPAAKPGPLRAALAPLGLQAPWLESRERPGDAPWLAVVGERADGRLVDALSGNVGAAVHYGPIQHRLLPGLRGQLYAQRLMLPQQQAARTALAERLCRRRPDLEQVRIVRVVPPGSRASASATAEQHVLARHACAPAALASP